MHRVEQGQMSDIGILLLLGIVDSTVMAMNASRNFRNDNTAGKSIIVPMITTLYGR
jgi:hypothetical protein